LDEDAAVVFAHDSVAGHEQPDVWGDVKGVVGELRVARPEDQVALDVDLEFAFKGGSDFDLGERPEGLALPKASLTRGPAWPVMVLA
jgi:hypothetical protein